MMINPDKSPLLSAVFSPDVAPMTKATVSIGAGVVMPTTDGAMVIFRLELSEWASVIAITYGLVCLFIALPKIFLTIRDLRDSFNKRD